MKKRTRLKSVKAEIRQKMHLDSLFGNSFTFVQKNRRKKRTKAKRQPSVKSKYDSPDFMCYAQTPLLLLEALNQFDEDYSDVDSQAELCPICRCYNCRSFRCHIADKWYGGDEEMADDYILCHEGGK